MLITELTDLECVACGEVVDVLAADFEPVAPLLCERCRALALEAEAGRRALAVAA